MASVDIQIRVTPLKNRAKWAQIKTMYDEIAADMQAKGVARGPQRRTIQIYVEIDDTHDALERVCRALSDGRTKIVKVIE